MPSVIGWQSFENAGFYYTKRKGEIDCYLLTQWTDLHKSLNVK